MAEQKAHIRRFRRATLGPELHLEQQVLEGVVDLLGCEPSRSWVGRSLPLGAGMPDLAVVVFDPCLAAAKDGSHRDAAVLAYLRRVSCATVATTAQRTGLKEQVVYESISRLAGVGAVCRSGEGYRLNQRWRSILSKVVAIEAKVSNWSGAVSQAIRNTVFAHQSFIAIPEHVAFRAPLDTACARFGIGVLAVGDEVRIVRRARTQRPKVWSYYYRLAAVVAEDVAQWRGGRDAIRRTNRAGTH